MRNAIPGNDLNSNIDNGGAGPPLAPVFPWFGMSCDVDSGIRDFRLDSSRLFYLVIYTKSGKEHFVWTKDESRLKSHVPESTQSMSTL